jgi:hypothetical protein
MGDGIPRAGIEIREPLGDQSGFSVCRCASAQLGRLDQIVAGTVRAPFSGMRNKRALDFHRQA